LRARLSGDCTTLRGRLKVEGRSAQRFATRRTTCADGDRLPPTGKRCDGQDARVDLGFGQCGYVLATINNEDEPEPRGLVVQRDGGILVLVTRTETDELTSGVVRFTSTGQLDQSFGMGGQAFLSVPGTGELATVFTVAADDRLIMVGGPIGASFALVA